MAEGVSTRLTAAEGRKFGFTVGLAFAAISGILYWRGKHIASAVTGTLATLLILGALAVPTMLGPVEKAWMGLAHLLSKVTTPIFMGIVYFGVMTPFGYFRRATGKSPMLPVDSSISRWVPHNPPVNSGESMERQF
ncbi:MAG: SxtJ family membrane protein [Gemmatimonadaceae bacterium]